ncbi:YbaB/EbfC family nucleoid-associated protein [Helicobacter saguini]|uniref:Nucleoid-associated protein DCO61_08060 n=1 Tax=Helicobacter saguini TaxID=1548018 RepID=A0A347VNL2_9HELI|nr:YbaB/EbfC family nucleoid-associated protein [Helicobacter saguini]MWV61725.1 YbaB/EbfC family nucleoid-associated protein [Helicobacter saguini]MWV67603.1 YbaB/EbfC family nucleoid-associated protein [Helicobacter saguini]MWV69954.1 YbaB/EbfC family nucleoid-associated protein [Helicobacter saguini]MWV72832.1 YbaB/EbfC family nucleoid-associated protein [Helicobacter saguini]TLD92372.1 YbaB/EbfC family nucleoid-associated protein [Helicobacter saguini]
MFDPKDLQNLLGSVQDQLKEYDEKAKQKIITSKSGGGLIDVKFNGVGELVDINIDDELLSDKAALQILLISAINEGYKQIEEEKKDDLFEQVKNLNPFKFQ